MAGRRVGTMDRWKRWGVALAVFGLLFGASLIVAGTTAEPVAPEDSPAEFGTAPSRPGDRGMYKTALVVVDGGRGEYFDMNARYAFERLDDRLMPANGTLVPVASFVGEWKSEPFRLPLRDLLGIPELPTIAVPTCGTEGVDWTDEDAVEEWEEECEEMIEEWEEEFEQDMEEWEEQMESWAESMEDWAEALDREFHTVEATGWHVTHHDARNATVALSYRDDTTFPRPIATQGLAFTGRVERVDEPGRLVFTEPVPVPGPCGWRTSLQDGPQDMWQPITVHGECPADMELGFASVRHEPGPILMRVSGRDRVAGQDAVVFSMPEDPDRLRLWFTQDQAYPVRVLTRTESVPLPIQEALGRDYKAPAFYVLHELIEFEPGHDAAAPGVPPLPSLAGQRRPTGPSLDGFDHPWPVAVALADAADPAKAPESCRTWRDWSEAHPDSIVQLARFTTIETDDPDHADPVVDEAWLLVATDASATRAVTVQRHTETVAETPALPTLPPQPVRTSTYACADAQAPDLPAPALGLMPTVAAAAALLEGFMGTQATGYEFEDVCIPSCSQGEGWLTVGVSPLAPGGGDAIDLLTLGPAGALRLHVASGDAYPEARFSDPTWSPGKGRDPWGFHVASSGVWVMPEPATAATLAAVGAAAGGLFLLWPALKAALAALPMFSRIRDEDLLEHPVRNQIHQTVTEEPGIHFQEMVRRVGKGRGTTEHHLRKMVAAGVLVEKAQRGFTCYFPKGRIDRNLMVAAPLMKSEGARQVMHAVAQQPGTAALDIAGHLGISTSTVNYHVKKLAEAGLLDTRRDGRFLRLALTGMGEQALGQFGGT